MKHRDFDQSVMIYPGIYSATIYEMEVWSLKNENFPKEKYEQQLKSWRTASCRIGMFLTSLEKLWRKDWEVGGLNKSELSLLLL